MTEKDRYGETLRDREKGAEDRYAAEQDRIRIEKLRQQAQSGVVVTKGLCPKCGAALTAAQKLELSVQTCGKCRGIWLAIEDLERIVASASEGEIVRFVRALLG